MAINPIVKNDIIQVTYYCTLYGQRIETVLHQRCEVAPGPASGLLQMTDLANTLADPLTNALLQGYQTLVCANFSFDYLRVQKIKPVREVYVQSPIGIVGTRSGTSMVQNIACSITKTTSVSGRKGVGRMQLCGFATSDIVAGNFTSAYLLLVRSQMSNYLQGIATPGQAYLGTYNMCLTGITPVVDDYDIITANAKTEARTMHRRTVGLGI